MKTLNDIVKLPSTFLNAIADEFKGPEAIKREILKFSSETNLETRRDIVGDWFVMAIQYIFKKPNEPMTRFFQKMLNAYHQLPNISSVEILEECLNEVRDELRNLEDTMSRLNLKAYSEEQLKSLTVDITNSDGSVIVHSLEEIYAQTKQSHNIYKLLQVLNHGKHGSEGSVEEVLKILLIIVLEDAVAGDDNRTVTLQQISFLDEMHKRVMEYKKETEENSVKLFIL